MSADNTNGALLIDSKEVAKILGVSSSTLFRMRCSKQLPPPVSVSQRLVKWRRSDIIAWIESRGQSSEVNS